MTTLSVISDLHLEFGSEPYITLPDSNVLILAGDITVAADLQPHRTDASARKHKEAMARLCDRINQKGYTSVLAIAGNHEYYGGGILEEVHFFLEEYYSARGIKFLHNQDYEIDDWSFYGGPLWTNMGNRNPLMMMRAQDFMNDYRTIFHANGDLINSEDTVLEHERTVSGLVSWLAKPTQKRRCVITHHAPSYGSIAPQYKTHDMNAAYASNLDYLVGEADVWVHGHTHTFFDYMIGDCRVICNPHGYHGYESNTGTRNIIIQ